MVKYIVYKKVREIPARCDVEDFISCGLEALIRSIDRFDPDKGATLEQFAWTRIHGSVLDELRRHDWAPRSVRRWERDIAQARERFISLYGRRPSSMSSRTPSAPRSTDDPPHGRGRRLGRRLAQHAGHRRRRDEDRAHRHAGEQRPRGRPGARLRDEAKSCFRAAFARLPERERQVAVLLYVTNPRCARSAMSSACRRAACARSTRSCAAASTNSSPASSRCSRSSADQSERVRHASSELAALSARARARRSRPDARPPHARRCRVHGAGSWRLRRPRPVSPSARRSRRVPTRP